MSAFHRRARTVLAALTVAAAACSRKEAADALAEGTPQAVVTAETAIAAAQPFTERVEAIGTVEPRAGHVAVLSAPMATRVSAVMVAAGQVVTRGMPLVELEQSGFQATLKSAQAALVSAQANHDRIQRLVDQGISPRRDLDQATADLARAQGDEASAGRMAELSVLRSPLDGVITTMNATLGASVDPTQPLVVIADPAAVDVVLSVQPTDAARVARGDQVAVHAGERARGDPLATGSVVDVAGVVDSATRSVAVRVRAGASRRMLRIGETVFGQVAIGTRPHAVVVPLAALVPAGDGFTVFVVDSAGIAHARPVQVGGKTDVVAEITSGLSAGERVVTYGAFGVDDGARIVSTPAAATSRAVKP